MPRRFLSSTALLGAVAVIAACGSSAEERPASKKADWRESKHGPQHAVVYVEARYKNRQTSGSGFIYDAAQGLVLTADHAVEAAPAITVTNHHGEQFHGRVVARAQCDDLAVLELHPVPDDLTAVKWARTPASIGQRVTTMAYGSRPTTPERMGFAQGEISGVNVKVKLNALLPPARSLIAYEAPAPEGSSGAPLVDDGGEAVGVNVLVGDMSGHASEGYVYALSASYVRSRLAQLRPGESGAYVGWRSQHRCHHAMAEIAAMTVGDEEMPPEDSGGMAMDEEHDHDD